MSQVVVITGASSGIGRATALEFAKRGARLVLGSRHEGAAASLMRELGEGRAVFKQSDVTSIRVNVVAPGPTLTPMLDRVTDGNTDLLASRVPMGRAASADEVARAIVWIASSEASFVTGAVLPVNGGMCAA